MPFNKYNNNLLSLVIPNLFRTIQIFYIYTFFHGVFTLGMD